MPAWDCSCGLVNDATQSVCECGRARIHIDGDHGALETHRDEVFRDIAGALRRAGLWLRLRFPVIEADPPTERINATADPSLAPHPSTRQERKRLAYAYISLVIVSIIAVYYAPTIFGNIFEAPEGFALLLLAAWCFAAYQLCILGFRRSRRLLQKDADEAQRTSRHIVWYVRRFEHDEENGDPHFDESGLAWVVSYAGAPLTIGRPGEELGPSLGFNRVYVNDDAWRDVVARHVERARLLIVLAAGYSEALEFELRCCSRQEHRRKLLLLVLSAPAYDVFRQGCASLFETAPLPEVTDGEKRPNAVRGAVTFREDGVPVYRQIRAYTDLWLILVDLGVVSRYAPPFFELRAFLYWQLNTLRA